MYTDYLNKISILDNNFLSLKECEDITNKLLSVKDRWQNAGPDQQPFNFLPFGLYSVDFFTYKDGVAKYKPMMLELFGSYYERIRDKLSQLLKVETVYAENLNYPGFHISTGLPFGENFHLDKFTSLHYFFNDDRAFHHGRVKILSIILPIRVPKIGAGLLIKNTWSDTSSNLALEYTPGMLASWAGSTIHSIKPYGEQDPEDHRITMQLHAAFVDSKAHLFW